MHAGLRARPLTTLFFVLALAHLIPIWAVRYMPTVDGPSHLYNASILLRLLTGDGARLNDFYQIDWRPNPNWLGHAMLAVMLTFLPPLLAEKILMSSIIILFLAAAWYFARSAEEGGQIYAFLALLLTYHQSLQFGYFNFSIAAGLFLIVVSTWWRRRDQPTARNISLIAGLLLLSDAAHPMPTALAMIAIGVLWLMTLRGRRLASHALHLLAFVPVSALILWFMRTQAPPSMASRPKLPYLIQFLAQARFLMTFDLRQFYYGAVVFLGYVTLAVATIWIERRSKREASAFGMVALAFLAMYFIFPSQLAGGLGINDRIGFFIFLVPLAWFTPRLPRRAQMVLIGLVTLAALANVAFLTTRYRRADRLLTEIVRTFDGADRDSAFVPILFDIRPPHSDLGLMSHTVDYAALENRLIDLANYEPEVGYFPIRYRPGIVPLNGYLLAVAQNDFDVAANAERADYIFTWKMPPGSPLEPRIEERYRLVRAWGFGRLYHRR